MVGFLGILILSCAISLDSLAAGLAFGINRIKIPIYCNFIINIFCSGILGASLFFGDFLKNFIPEPITNALCFGILFLMGISKILDEIAIRITKKNPKLEKDFSFLLFHLNFLIKIYSAKEKNTAKADFKIMPIKEAISLGLALSLDGLTLGIGLGINGFSSWAFILTTFAVGFAAIWLGKFLGHFTAKKSFFDISWLSGIIFIILAIMKIN